MSLTTHVPTQHEVETFTGRYVDTKHPVPGTICIEDIAHALAATCRYGGHCQNFYSVAEHAVFCSIRAERKGWSNAVQLAALHHDDAEAYLGDIPRPMKSLLGAAYRKLTARMDAAIITALGLSDEQSDFHSPAVKDADNWALLVEARHLLPSRGINWSGSIQQTWEIESLPKRIITPDYWHGGVIPEVAEDMFLSRHEDLTNG
jgi:hypothetical protein